jgi:hypothetical protein
LLGIEFGRLSSEIETIKIHHLRPCSHKVLHELLLGISAGVDLGKSAELGVRSKDDDRLKVEQTIDPGLLKVLMPPFSFQPLLFFAGLRSCGHGLVQ